MRTVDADALLERWCSEVCKVKPRCDEDCMFYDYLTLDSLSPTIEPQPHWIPVSERLPENDGYYLVSEDDGNIEVEWYDNTGWGYCGVIAWMFLPTPYRKEPNDEMVCYEIQREDSAAKDDKRFFNALKPNKEIDRSWGIGMKVPVCPNCEAIISPMCFWKNCGDKVGWCEYCGQKIDWSGWEDE